MDPVNTNFLIDLLNSTGSAGGVMILIILFYNFMIDPILKIIWNRKDNTRRIAFEQEQRKMFSEQREVIEKISEYLKTLTQHYTDNITYIQAVDITTRYYEHSACKLLSESVTILEENNLTNGWDNVVEKVTMMVDNAWTRDYNYLQRFKYLNVNLNLTLRAEWKEEIVKMILDSLAETRDKPGMRCVETRKRLKIGLKSHFVSFISSAISFIDEQRDAY